MVTVRLEVSKTDRRTRRPTRRTNTQGQKGKQEDTGGEKYRRTDNVLFVCVPQCSSVNVVLNESKKRLLDLNTCH